MMILFKKLRADAIEPVRATTHAAGFDLCAPERVEIAPGKAYWVPSGIAMAIPAGWVGLIWPRSGLAYKHGIDTLGGVIDADYRGEVKIGLINLGSETVEIKAGERVCQLVVQPYLGECEMVDELPDADSNRTGGFGSTGSKALSVQPVATAPVCAPMPHALDMEHIQQAHADRTKPQ